MASSQGRVNRPYRKASEYLVTSNKNTSGVQLQSSQGNEVVNQKLVLLTRKLERAEAEYAQSREYLENQLDLSHDRELKLTEQHRKLQSSFAALQTKNRELEQKIMQVSATLSEKNRLAKEVNELSNKLEETRSALFKTQEENERLRKDCNLAVQLLKCNQSSYQVRKPAQQVHLTDGVQEQINSYKVELQNYNEYINPYASDSDGDDALPAKSQHNSSNYPCQIQTNENEIPVEFLAKALKKPENVHINLEPSDYIDDPALHSVYKAHYVERKLIRPDYDQGKAAYTSTRPMHYQTFDGNSADKSSMKQEENSPWELAPTSHGLPRCEESIDDESPAGAYGAYSVKPKRHISRTSTKQASRAEKPVTKSNHFKESEFSDSFENSGRPASPTEIQFRTPAAQAKSRLSGYFSKSAKGSPAISLSSGSSKRSSPLKVRGKETASVAETSSLLNQLQSDEDENQVVEIVDYPNKQTSPEKRYMKEKLISGEKGALLGPEDEDDYDLPLPPPPPEISLEWVTELNNHNIHEENTSDDVNELSFKVQSANLDQPEDSMPQPNLLLSYSNVESPTKLAAIEIEEFNKQEQLRSSQEDESFLDTPQHLPTANHSGQLLSEIVTNNPSLSDFLLSNASTSNEERSQLQFQNDYITTQSARPTVDIDLSGSAVITRSDLHSVSLPFRVDDQIEVIDLDEEPRNREINRRRNSFEQAREFGNILTM